MCRAVLLEQDPSSANSSLTCTCTFDDVAEPAEFGRSCTSNETDARSAEDTMVQTAVIIGPVLSRPQHGRVQARMQDLLREGWPAKRGIRPRLLE